MENDHTTDPQTARRQRDLFAWSLLAALLLLGVLAGPFFSGRVYTKDDLGAFHLPTRAFYAERLAQGEPFDWMPQLYAGFYLTGEGQVGTYHPFHLAIYRFLPLRVALGWEWLASYPLLLAGTFLLLRRRLGRSDAAMFGSLIFTFSGFNLLHFVHPNAIAVVAHVPWLLWAIDIVLVESGRAKVTLAQAAVAALTGSQLLLGYPQYVWFSLLIEAAYVAAVLIGRERILQAACEPNVGRVEALRHWPARGGRLLLAKASGMLLGAVQLLPTVDALAHSTRQAADSGFAYAGSLHPLNAVQLVAPYLLTDRVFKLNTHEAGLYMGAVPLMLIVWLWVRRRDLGTLGYMARAVSWLGALALLMALGRYSPLYSLQTYLPLVGHFRFPSRYIVLFHFATAGAAAMGFMVLLRDAYRNRSGQTHTPASDHDASPWRALWREFKPLWVVAAASGAAALVGLVLQGQRAIGPAPAVLAGPLLLGAAALLVALAARGVRGALVGLILFAAFDLGCYGMTYAVYPRSVPLARLPHKAVIPPGGPDGRVLASHARLRQRGLRMGNEVTLAGWNRVDGYAGLEPRQRLDYGQVAALRVAAVRWVRRNPAAEEIYGLAVHDDLWLEVPQPLPRVRLVTRAQQSDNPARDVARIDVETTVLTEIPLELPEAAPGTAETVSERPGRLHIRCNGNSPQLLTVAESFHPGWRATVDGKPQRVLRINGDFLGCRVGPGQREVVLEFRPRSLYWGRIVSGLGLVVLLVTTLGCLCLPTERFVRRCP